MHTKKISFVIPAYNEGGGNIGKIEEELRKVMTTLPFEYEIIFVDDGSSDTTLQEIKTLAHKTTNVFYVELSRNFGHQPAIKCGMDLAKGDCVITMDADLQHPPTVVPQLITLWEEGFDLVYTVRQEDKRLSYMKRKTSSLFYSMLNKLSEIKLEKGEADFRLLDRVVVEAFTKFTESELFLRGLVKWMGFRQTAVYYTPNERFAGSSKYNLSKMLSFGLKGITSFSVRPLTLTVAIGMLFLILSLLYIPYLLVSFYMGNVISGWTSIMATVIFFGGLQLIMIGIIGMYIGKLSIQSKQRPLYFIRDTNYKTRS